MCLLVQAAIAPFRQTVLFETQRGDQGGLRAYDTCPARPEMKQEATFVDEHWQAICLQIEQTSTNTPCCADWPTEEVEHASVKHARERCRHATSSSDQGSAPDIRQTIYVPDVVCISSLPELR